MLETSTLLSDPSAENIRSLRRARLHPPSSPLIV
jgi:hypothetical protein